MTTVRRICMFVSFVGYLCILTPAMGQESQSDAQFALQPAAMTHQVMSANSIDRVATPPIDLAAVEAEDQTRDEYGLAPRFAIPNATMISPSTHGTWETLEGDTMLWRLRINAPDAKSINLGFTRFALTPNARLMIYSTDLTEQMRPLTADDNDAHGEFWTPVVLTDDLLVELTIPQDEIGDLQLEIGSINHGYRLFGKSDETSGPRSGSCNVDVICPEGDNWRDEIQTVAVISTGGYTFCTGFMVNNTAEDGTPYFMTAHHCEITASNDQSLVTYWNFQSPVCGQQSGGSLSQWLSGSTLRATYSTSDFTLVELDDALPESYNIAFAGWNRGSGNPTSACGIHHPSTDEKSISFENAACTTTSYLGTSTSGDGTHIRVIDWDTGTTEGGSSGSPLFDQNHFVVGQLHGGYAACGNNDSDWYGRFSVSWNGGGSSSSRLSNWLDPLGTGQTTLGMLVPGQDELILEPTNVPLSALPGETFDVAIEITTKGDETLVPGTPTVHYRYSVGAYQSISMTSIGNGLYKATLPEATCEDTPEIYFSAEGTVKGLVFEPADAPSTVHSLIVGELDLVLDDDFETNTGWTVSGNPSGTSSGRWERGVPANGDRGDPPADYDGSGQCWVTGNATGNTDVDDGTTIITSPVLDMSNGGEITYAYWLNDVENGRLGTGDGMTVEIATNAAGTNWQTLRTYLTAAAAWRTDTINVGTEVAASSTLRIRVSAMDVDSGNVVEAGFDACFAQYFECTQITCPVAKGDMNADGSLNGEDIIVFVGCLLDGSAGESGCVCADMDASGGLDASDVSAMVDCLLGLGCP